MSEVHVHGVIAAGDPPKIEAAPTRCVTHKDVAALVTDVDQGGLSAARVVRLHWRVLEEAGADRTVLPVRFGTVMADERAVVDDFLAPRRDVLAAELAELEGKVQLTVKGFFEEEALMRGIVSSSPAVARMRERVKGVPEAAAYYDRIELGQLIASEVERVRERDSAQVLERLSPLALATSHEPVTAPDAAVNAAFLVERGRVDEFSDAVAKLGQELQGRVRLRYVGPLPPYSFAGDNAPDGSGTWV